MSWLLDTRTIVVHMSAIIICQEKLHYTHPHAQMSAHTPVLPRVPVEIKVLL